MRLHFNGKRLANLNFIVHTFKESWRSIKMLLKTLKGSCWFYSGNVLKRQHNDKSLQQKICFHHNNTNSKTINKRFNLQDLIISYPPNLTKGYITWKYILDSELRYWKNKQKRATKLSLHAEGTNVTWKSMYYTIKLFLI